jgi:hypothetical protein
MWRELWLNSQEMKLKKQKYKLMNNIINNIKPEILLNTSVPVEF